MYTRIRVCMYAHSLPWQLRYMQAPVHVRYMPPSTCTASVRLCIAQLANAMPCHGRLLDLEACMQWKPLQFIWSYSLRPFSIRKVIYNYFYPSGGRGVHAIVSRQPDYRRKETYVIIEDQLLLPSIDHVKTSLRLRLVKPSFLEKFHTNTIPPHNDLTAHVVD